MDKIKRMHNFSLIMQEAKDRLNVTESIKALDYIGYFDAPAAAKHHSKYVGGLYDHSYEVTKALVELTEKMNLKWEHPASPLIVGMFHDLCKCDQYVLQHDGTFEYNKDVLIPGHGEKSVIIAQKFLELTTEEILCIRWHMGAFDEKENWNRYSNSIALYPNVLWTHTADMIAAKIKKV